MFATAELDKSWQQANQGTCMEPCPKIISIRSKMATTAAAALPIQSHKNDSWWLKLRGWQNHCRNQPERGQLWGQLFERAGWWPTRNQYILTGILRLELRSGAAVSANLVHHTERNQRLDRCVEQQRHRRISPHRLISRSGIMQYLSRGRRPMCTVEDAAISAFDWIDSSDSKLEFSGKILSDIRYLKRTA
jgi:hypothetical protein